MSLPKIKRQQFAESYSHITHRAKPCTAWVRCECGRSQRKATDVHCILCDHEDNREIAGLATAARYEPSIDSQLPYTFKGVR